jgi:hypothetical protein
MAYGENSSQSSQSNTHQGILTWGGGGRLSTVDLLIKVACFVKEVNKIFNLKRS